MSTLWQKPIFWIIFFVLLIILIPLLFYFLKPQILSVLPLTNIQPSEIIKPGDCLILEEKFCSQAELVNWTSPSRKKMPLIVFNLPPGVSLFMNIDGQVTKTKLPDDGVFKGFEAMIFDPNDPNTLRYVITGDLKFDNMLSLNLKKGAAIGTTQNTGVENAGGHNLIVYIIRGTGREAVANEHAMYKLFSSIKP